MGVSQYVYKCVSFAYDICQNLTSFCASWYQKSVTYGFVITYAGTVLLFLSHLSIVAANCYGN